MKTNAKKGFLTAAALLALFVVWTVLIRTVDVRPDGQNGTDIGFAAVKREGIEDMIQDLESWGFFS